MLTKEKIFRLNESVNNLIEEISNCSKEEIGVSTTFIKELERFKVIIGNMKSYWQYTNEDII